MEKYHDLPMSFADACLVRLSEIRANAKVMTCDRHFQLYRRLRNERIPLIAPWME